MKKLAGLLTFFISFNSLATDEHIHRYERLSADEVVYQKQILEGILELQNANMENGKRMRGTHAKRKLLNGIIIYS
ncbi:MAG: hypothetical protein M9962_00785 [Oligoflexia bacterium]|nr:hypothetical protein [Oligoflexia bacterium]